MSLEWIIIESIAVFVESYAKAFFIVSQTKTKHNSLLSIFILVVVTSGWGLFATFYYINQFVYNAMVLLLELLFMYFFVIAPISQKVVIALLASAIAFITTLLGVGITSLFIRITISSTIKNQDSSRLVIIILIKMTQIIVFLWLSRIQLFKRELSRKLSPILLINSILAFAVNLFIWFYLSATPVETSMNSFLIAASVCIMLILLGGFIMYDLFAKLEQQKSELSRNIQRSDMEFTFREEIKNMHADLQKWRHEYKNNLLALKGYITENDRTGALEYIERIAETPLIGKPLVITNNAALDAVINSKLWSAENRGIKVSAQSIFPSDRSIRVSDDDLCSIIGNLLDNSTEACDRITGDMVKFLTLELLIKGDNLFIMIYNSYSGEILRDGEAFISSKSSIHNGIGLKYVDSLIDKYEGFSIREYDNGVFFTQVMIPLLTPKQGGYYNGKNNRRLHRSMGKRRSGAGR